MKKTRFALFQSIVALILCVSMLTGTTFAWFNDNVSSTNNLIASGILDVELEYLVDGKWVPVTEETEVLNKNALWEPGYTEVAYLKISNEGNLALKYAFGVGVLKEIGSINSAGQKFFLSDYIKFGVIESDTQPNYTSREAARKALTSSNLIVNGYSSENELPLYPKGNADNLPSERYVTLVVYIPEEVGNAANYATGATIPEIQLGIQLKATQAEYESDSFGTGYDTAATLESFNFPNKRIECSTSAGVESDEENMSTSDVTLTDDQASAVVPAGVRLNGGNVLTLKVNTMDSSDANITMGENDEKRSLNVHVDGIAEDNTVPMAITIKEAAPKGLNSTSIDLYHVENGETVKMTPVEEIPAHNQFKYDPVTGDITLYMATFSEVAVVADTENAWEGKFDYTWYDASKTELTIANADQLAAFGAIVGGMNGQTRDSFAGKTVKLIANVNLGDKESENNADLIFYPIGYYNSTGSYEKTSGGSVTSSVSSFEGTFDGNGHIIANFYQNTWEMFGDYNDGYSGTPNHYKDAMGLFGYVDGGTIKNLTVSHFSSDGEYTPTGVIAAYADGNSTFENIAITNCNPRVYNTGNGGIIGIAGSTSAANDDHITLKNITVDNSNKISALWGSYDVACGGLVGMYRGNVDGNGKETGDTIHFENCHVSAQIDVYNDVCANYQYYAYRYAGMIIGSVRHNTTAEGKTIPNMAGISASGCTVNYGDWNDYYYCEFEKNTMASYSEDYQFSRVPHSELNFTDTNGNGVVDANERASVTGCKHDHTAEENHQAVYLPFHQLFTGYSWGVSSIGLKEYSGIVTNLGITEGDQQESVVKFEGKATELANNQEYKLGDIFAFVDNGVKLVPSALTVTVTNVDENGKPVENGSVNAEVNLENDNWEERTITLTGTGRIQITIQDYYFCTPTTITVNVIERKEAEKFESKFTGNFLYRVGNQNAVSLGSLFDVVKNEDGTPKYTINNSGVVVKVDENSNVSSTFTADTTDWTKGTIKFEGTGVVKVTITDKDYCTPTELTLEVVDATNATSATSAKSNNVVLLNDVGFSTIEVSGGYTLYGNGFKMTATTDPMYDTLRAGFVTLDNGILDNVQVICPNFSYAIIYNSQIKDSANTAIPSDSSNDARGNVRSAVMATGNSKIINSYVHGGRAAIFLRSGNLLVNKSTISGGAAANIHALSAQSLTLRNATLIQKPFQATVHDTSKTLMGFSGLFECDADGNSTPLILEGTLVQDAWINEGYIDYTPSAASSIVENALSKTAYLHDLDGDGKNESLNLGFTYIPQETKGSTSTENVKDNRINKDTVPYEAVDVGNVLASAKVYSYKNTNGTDADFSVNEEYVPNAQGATPPTVSFTDTNADRVFETKFDANDGRWESSLTVNLDNGNYTFSFDKLLVQKNGANLGYTVAANGTAIDTSKTIALTASGMTEYVLTVTDGDATHTVYFTLTASKTSIPDPVVADTTGGTPLLVVKSKNSDWTVGLPALEGIKVKYYTADGEVILDLATLTPTSKGKQNGTNNYWEISKDGYKLKVTCGVIHDTKSVYGMPVVVDNNGTMQMYFTISSTNGYVSTGTSARSVTLTYEFTDPNGKTLTFTKNYNVKYADYKEKAQYKYSDFVNGTMTDLLTSSSGGDECITEGTLITMADGSRKPVEDLKVGDLVMVFNHVTGSYEAVPLIFNTHSDVNEAEYYDVLYLQFSNDSELKIVQSHGVFDMTLMQYVYIGYDNYQDYIGHEFYALNSDGNGGQNVKLVNAFIKNEKTRIFCPVTYFHMNSFANGLLNTPNIPGGITGLVNYFEYDSDLKYNEEAMQRDIEKYGLYSYADFSDYISEAAYNSSPSVYLKVAVGKGMITYEQIIDIIEWLLAGSLIS